MPPRREAEYVLFADESVVRGKYYSNFYGGVIVGASHYQKVTERLSRRMEAEGLHGEAKWSKVTDQYLDRYIAFMDAFFAEVAEARVKARVMFTKNASVPPDAVRREDDAYFKLYYQFIKHAFGVRHLASRPGGTRLRLYFDEFPATREAIARFRGYLLGLGASSEFRRAGLVIRGEDIAEVRSHDHPLLQAIDVVLGAMAFRLNDQHKVIPEGQRRRGRRTIAKEKLYGAIKAHVLRLRPRFNFGTSTGWDGDEANLWRHPYRHWCFEARDATHDPELTKRSDKKRRRPSLPT